MPRGNPENFDLILVEETVWVLVGKVDLPSYDFSLSPFFACRRPWHRSEPITAIGRFGAAANYDEVYRQMAADGIFLVHSQNSIFLPASYLIGIPCLKI